MYIMGENPMISDPDLHHVEKALKNLEFLVVQDIFMTETAELADVVLPACLLREKDGTQTSTERRVQMWRTAQAPPGRGKSRLADHLRTCRKDGLRKAVPVEVCRRDLHRDCQKSPRPTEE